MLQKMPFIQIVLVNFMLGRLELATYLSSTLGRNFAMMLIIEIGWVTPP